MLLSLLFLIFGFGLLVIGGDLLVDGATALAKKFNIPEIVIGLTIVACGTSAPEFAVSLSSVITGHADVGVGNILGSNLANILLIGGVSALIYSLRVKKNTVLYEIPFLGFISLLVLFMGWRYGAITQGCAWILCCLFLLFLLYLFVVGKNNEFEKQEFKNMSIFKTICFILFGIAALIFGANLTINSATDLARIFNVSERIIGLTIIAFGTSLPELVTCVTAAIKKRSDLVVGNIVGSNVFNILFVLGLSGLIQPIPFEYNFLMDAAFGVIAAVILWLFVFRDSILGKGNGFSLLVLYGFYIAYLIK